MIKCQRTENDLPFSHLSPSLFSRAVGARNFPQYSSRGEDVFRGAFEEGLSKLGASIHRRGDHDNEVVIVDFGCGTGTSTRRLAKQYPQATKLIGIDLSPYFIDVGKLLLKLAPSAIDTSDDCSDKHGWITTIDSDERIQLRQGDIASTQLPSNSVSAVNLSMVLHELPIYAAKEVILEAHRILKPGGQMWISEMDFESPAYKAQRENALLFSLLRATEPYLDEYADGMRELRNFIADKFGVLKINAATGRHYALFAEKSKNCLSDKDSKRYNVLEDYRFREDGSYSINDTHLKPWESKLDTNT
jgi:ubiquinone/menaquinone biosynthesis C-methylase UbiE